MIDKLLTDLFTKWNEDKKCGKCWKYVRTFNDHINGLSNLYTPPHGDECCTHIFLEGMDSKVGKEFNQDTGLYTNLYCDYNLHFKVVEQSNFQLPKADEHGSCDSIYEKHVQPIMDCISCDFEKDLCDTVESGATISNESSKPYFSGGDLNWAGIDLRLTFRVYV